jgi:hypothetical protein
MLLVLGRHFQVQAQFRLEIGVTPARTERAAETREPLAEARSARRFIRHANGVWRRLR